MKRLFAVILSIIMVIGSCILSFEDIFPAVSAGAGRAENLTVNNIYDLGNLLETPLFYISGIKTTKQRSLSTFDESYETEYFTLDHTSMTLSESVTARIGTNNNYMTLERSLKIYMTTEATYYVSNGTTYTQESDSSSCLDFDIEAYFNGENLLLKLNRWEVSNSFKEEENEETVWKYEGVRVIPEMKGKWLSASQDDIIEIFNSVGELNSQAIDIILGYIEDCEESETEQKVYNLKDSIYSENDTDIVINTTNATEPVIEMIMSGNIDIQNATSRDYYMNSTMSFANINNTVVNFSDNPLNPIVEIGDIEDIFAKK